MKYCSNCGAEHDDSATVCVKCGNEFEAAVVAPVSKQDPNESGVLWWFLGFFVPMAGLILYILWLKEYPKRAKSAGLGALISTIASVVISVLYVIIYVVVVLLASGTFDSLLSSI